MASPVRPLTFVRIVRNSDVKTRSPMSGFQLSLIDGNDLNASDILVSNKVAEGEWSNDLNNVSVVD
jgi:hypothetical protein